MFKFFDIFFKNSFLTPCLESFKYPSKNPHKKVLETPLKNPSLKSLEYFSKISYKSTFVVTEMLFKKSIKNSSLGSSKYVSKSFSTFGVFEVFFPKFFKNPHSEALKYFEKILKKIHV